MKSPPGCFSSRSIFLLFLVKWTFWGALQPPPPQTHKKVVLGFSSPFQPWSEWKAAGRPDGWFLDRPLSWHPSPLPFFYVSLSCPLFSFGDPLDPVEPHSVHPTCEGSARTPARINQPVNVRIFVPVLTPPSPSPSPSRSLAYLCPIAGKLAPFSALPSPLERTSQGLNGAILCLIAPAPP